MKATKQSIDAAALVLVNAARKQPGLLNNARADERWDEARTLAVEVIDAFLRAAGLIK